MSTRRLGLAATAAVVVLLIGGAVSVTAATKVTIRLDSSNAGETFTTTGDALCSAGTATTDFDHFGGGRVAGSFHLTKELVCTDGSGTFVIRVNAATVFGSPTDQGGWSVQSGTGAYAGMHGGGSLVGTYYGVGDAAGIIDMYTGVVTK